MVCPKYSLPWSSRDSQVDYGSNTENLPDAALRFLNAAFTRINKGVGEFVGVRVGVKVSVGVRVNVRVGVRVGVWVGVKVGVLVAVVVGIGVFGK